MPGIKQKTLKQSESNVFFHPWVIFMKMKVLPYLKDFNAWVKNEP